MTELTVDSVCPKGPIYPMIIDFQNGYPTEDFEISCALLQDKNGSRMIATELSELVYAGKEVKEELGNTFILARNRKTGKVRLIEMGRAELKPFSKKDMEATDQQESSMLELSRKFGSKKQKKQMEHREKLKVNVQTVTEQMTKVTANISVDKLDLSGYNKTDDDFYIPPINREAKKVEDVYEIDKILTEDQYETIYAELQESESEYMKNLHPFMKSFIKDKTLNPRLTVLAVFASQLLKSLPLKITDIRKKDFYFCESSTTLNNVIINGFTENVNGKRTRPHHYKDKALCHIIVFMLLLNNFKFEIEPICNELKTTVTTFGVKARLVGASVSSYNKDKRIVLLKIPLAPKNSFSRNRKSAKF